MPKIAVFGGTGYLASILKNQNNLGKIKYIFFSRNRNLKNIIKYSSLKKNSNFLRDFDLVIHMSGPNQNQLKKNKNLIKKKDQTTSNICDLCLAYKLRLIYISSMQVYKFYGKKNININSKKNMESLYSKSHLQSEKIISSKFINHKQMYTIMRVGNVFGFKKYTNYKEIKNNLIHNLCYLALKKKKISIINGSIQRNFVPSQIFAQFIKYVINKKFFKNSRINIFYQTYNLFDISKLIQKRIKIKLNIDTRILIKNSKPVKKFKIYTNRKFKINPNKTKFINEIDQILISIMKKVKNNLL